MATEPIFLGRQPILDRTQRIVAYELLFRSGDVDEARVTDDVAATSSVIRHAFAELGVQAVLGSYPGYINVSASVLLSDAVLALPPEHVVLELLETIEIEPAIIDRCRELKALGYRLALDDFIFAPQYEPLLALVDVVKIDLSLHPRDALETLVRQLRQWPVQLLAEKVDNAELAQHCMALGFELFQGFFYARPALLTGSRGPARPADPVLEASLHLSLAPSTAAEACEDHPTDPALAAGLRRILQQPADPGDRCDCARAREQLGTADYLRRLALLPYVMQADVAFPGALLLLAATRAYMMENLARLRGESPATCETAYRLGALSLLDSLFGQPLGDLVQTIHPDPVVAQALLARSGTLGHLLQLVESVEHPGLSNALALLTPTGLTLSDLNVAQIGAMVWANHITEH